MFRVTVYTTYKGSPSDRVESFDFDELAHAEKFVEAFNKVNTPTPAPAKYKGSGYLVARVTLAGRGRID